MSKIIYCTRSNVPLVHVSIICKSAGWPFLQSLDTQLIHPIYTLSLSALLVRLNHHFKTDLFLSDPEAQEDVKLCMSAILYELDTLQSYNIPSLPSTPVARASGHRLLNIASWYHYETSQRIVFPKYAVSRINNNLNWQNFSSWLDAVDAIKLNWETGKSLHQIENETRLRTVALQTVKAEAIYKRLDFNKIWSWIDIQLQSAYNEGRRTTFKSIFMEGDVNPELWNADDVDDLSEAILLHCDIGNEITFFIRTRLAKIRKIINDFYGSFTIVSSKDDLASEAAGEAAAGAAEKQLLASFDNMELGPQPLQKDFKTLGLFLKAQAQHNLILRRREHHGTV